MSFLSALIFSIGLIMTSNASAKDKRCQEVYTLETSALEWTAFKTPKKVGVKGSFKTIDWKTLPHKNLASLLQSAQFTIDTQSVSTGNPERDKKIQTFFFQKDGKAIALSGKVKSVSTYDVVVEMTFNGVTKEIPFKGTMTDKTLTLQAVMDINTFSLAPQLEAINKACKALHEGITWPDVELKLTAQLPKKCL